MTGRGIGSKAAVLARSISLCALVLSALAAVGFVWLWILNLGTSASLVFGNRATPFVLAGSGVVFACVGWLVSSRRPDNAVGWVTLAIGVTALVSTLFTQYAIFATRTRPDALPGGSVAAWLGNFIWVPAVGLLGAVLVLIFPDGHLQSPRWKPVMVAAVSGMVGTMIYFTLAPGPLESLPWIDNPFGLEGSRPWIELFALGFFVMAGTVPLAAWSMRTRYRSSSGVARAQIRWFASAAAVVALLYVGQFIYSVATGTLDGGTDAQRWFQTFAVAGFGAMGASVGVAVTHYRLYEIDRIISRTITYALVVGLLGLVVFALVTGLALFLPSEDPLIVAAATLTVFALFNPTSRRMQRWVDRRFNRSRYDAAIVIDRFSGELQGRADPEQVMQDWVGVVEKTMQPATVGIWVRT